MESKATETKEIIQQIKQILVEEMQLNLSPLEIPDDYSLLEGGLGLDSILIAELIARIEDRFGLRFDNRVLEAQLFNSLSILAGFVGEEISRLSSTYEGQSSGATC